MRQAAAHDASRRRSGQDHVPVACPFTAGISAHRHYATVHESARHAASQRSVSERTARTAGRVPPLVGQTDRVGGPLEVVGVEANVHIESQGLTQLLLEEATEGATVETAHECSDEVTERQRVLADMFARGPVELGLLDARDGCVPVDNDAAVAGGGTDARPAT